ncbi:MAG: tyrosine-type recombinase/integrase [bacterium]
MALMLKRQRNGSLRDEWYGVYTEDGRRKVVNLDVKIQGVPPASLAVGDLGNKDFEASRKEATKALVEYVEAAQHKGRAEHLTERLIESKSGEAPEYVKIAELPDRWLGMTRDAPLSEGYTAECKAILGRFVAYMKKHRPKVTYLYQVKSTDADAFAASVRKEMSPRTYFAHLGIVRPAFDYFLPAGAVNPFRKGLRGKRRSKTESSGSIHRVPFTPAELEALVAAAKDDEFMRQLIITAACTGMRRSDVCQLKWSAVDLAGGMLAVKTSKTGAEVEIPIFQPLRAVLEARGGNGKAYVFPEAVKMLADNPDGLTWRFKKIVAMALDKTTRPALPTASSRAEVEAEGTEAIMANLPEGGRRDRILDTFRHYCMGKSYNAIGKATNRAKTTIAVDLHAVQDLVTKRFMRNSKGYNVTKAIARITRVPRVKGMRAASIRDWHALRTTFVTLALSAGVPLELVRRITGHSTADIVLKHYFRPDREQFRAALTDAMPDILTGKTTELKPADEFGALAKKVAAGSATTEDKERMAMLLKEL